MKKKISGKQQIRVALTMKETGLFQKKKRSGQYRFDRDIIKNLVQAALGVYDAEYASTGKLMLSFRYQVKIRVEDTYTRVYGILPQDDFDRVVFYSELTGLPVQKFVRYMVLSWIYEDYEE